ncbi:serine/threonine-protein kinase [Microcoleus sp. B7-D4]|uniref:serine/threonine-protein kinase n=1 Tax=Microcoleus sp. B7-D4 TaxID=2818696 RepID=UPI002FD3D1F0
MASEVLKERYVIEQQLSQTAGRRTFMARDLHTEELVAIKLLIFGEDVRWDDLKLFEREAQTLQLLSHPAIPRYLDYFEVDTPTGKGFALVQSYIPAKSLEEWLKSGRTFNKAEVKQLAKALLEILDYLHGQQPPVIHRDIKPSNILLANRSGNSVGDVYLVDFGSIQTLAARKGGTITVVGTYGYMPPEQFGGRNVPASDIYSLGATLIYLVTGRHPAELSQGNLQIQFESLVNLNRDLIDWLKWMTQPSLNRRLASAKEALEALENPRPKTDISAARRKLIGSRIKLKKDGEKLEILIPPKKLGFWRGYWIGTGILVELGLVLLIFLFIKIMLETGYIVFMLVGALFLLIFSIVLLCSLFITFSQHIQTYFKTTTIKLDRQHISVTKRYPWCKFRAYPFVHEDISPKIMYIRKSRDFRWQYKSYKTINVSDLTAPEIEVLANEISTISHGKLVFIVGENQLLNR